MLMPDVNILINANREVAPEYPRYSAWLSELVSGSEPFALSEPVVQGFLRVITGTVAFSPPTSMAAALMFIDALLASPNCNLTRPGPRHWSIFRELCERPGIKGKLVADAAHAALAIESGCEWVTADTDFARFSPPLRWRHL